MILLLATVNRLRADNDIITDFQTGAGGDILQINGTNFKTLADVAAAMQQVGTDVVLSLGNGEELTLENTQVQKFTASPTEG